MRIPREVGSIGVWIDDEVHGTAAAPVVELRLHPERADKRDFPYRWWGDPGQAERLAREILAAAAAAGGDGSKRARAEALKRAEEVTA